MSASATSLLSEAQASVAQLIARLREMEAAAREQDSLMTTRLRQAQRALDEVVLQQQYARQHQQPSAVALQQREQELRAMFKQIARETEEVQHAHKQLDQIIRQIEMSSAVLRDEPTRTAQPDPWTLALRSQVVLGREEERVRLAREVHDGPAQVLANSLMIAEQCRTLVQEQRTADLGLMLDRMCAATREGLGEVRQFIADLRPGQLAEQGLVGGVAGVHPPLPATTRYVGDAGIGRGAAAAPARRNRDRAVSHCARGPAKCLQARTWRINHCAAAAAARASAADDPRRRARLRSA